jgi:hypothetical protein
MNKQLDDCYDACSNSCDCENCDVNKTDIEIKK